MTTRRDESASGEQNPAWRLAAKLLAVAARQRAAKLRQSVVEPR